MVTGYFHLYFNELHAAQFHFWRKSQEPNNNQTPPCDVPWRSIRVQYLQTEHFTPSPVPKCKSFFFHNNAAAQTHLSLKGASKWKKFSLISAHRCYAETPHEFNILTSFLKRIWIKLSESVSQLKIGPFLCVLDQNYLLSDTVNIYWWKTCGEWHTDFTNCFDANHGYNELVRSLTFCFTSNFGGIFWQLDLYKSAKIVWSLTKTIPVNDFVLSLTKHQLISRLGLVTHKTYPRNWLCLSLTKPPLISWHGLVIHKTYSSKWLDCIILTKPPLFSWHLGHAK